MDYSVLDVITLNGITAPIRHHLQWNGVREQTFRSRIKAGWRLEDAIMIKTSYGTPYRKRIKMQTVARVIQVPEAKIRSKIETPERIIREMKKPARRVVWHSVGSSAGYYDYESENER